MLHCTPRREHELGLSLIYFELVHLGEDVEEDESDHGSDEDSFAAADFPVDHPSTCPSHGQGGL